MSRGSRPGQEAYAGRLRHDQLVERAGFIVGDASGSVGQMIRLSAVEGQVAQALPSVDEGRRPVMMEVLTPTIWKTSTCAALPSRALT